MKRSQLVALLPIVLAACSSGSSVDTPAAGSPAGDGGAPSADAAPPTADGGPSSAALVAEQALFDAMHAADVKAGEAAVAKLQAVYDASPTDAHNTLLLGTGSIWLASESGRDPTTRATMEQKYAPTGARYVQEAHALSPDYGFATSFAGFVIFDRGSNTGDPKMTDQGKQLIDLGLQQSGASGWFFELLVAERVAPGDPQMQKTIDAAWSYYDACGEERVDRTKPDFSAYFAKGKGKPFCADDDKAPFGVEGLLLNFGDLLVKQGSVDVAKAVYEGAQSSPHFAAWPHKDALNARLASDLPARAAAYQGEPSGWPALGDPPYTCTVCHGVTAK